MPLYDEATTPGSTRQNVGPAGAIIPLPAPIRELPREIFSGASRSFGAGSFLAPPPGSVVSGAPTRALPAIIDKPLPALGPSIAGTVARISPAGDVATIARELPAIGQRPLLPVGLRERVAETLPPGVRKRATVWARAVARFRSGRPSMNNRVTRE